MSSGKALYPFNRDEPEYYISRNAQDDGSEEPAAGETGFTVRLSETPDGPAVDASVSKGMSERSAKPGYFYAAYEGADLGVVLQPYIGRGLYEIVAGPSGNLIVSVYRRVFKERRPTSGPA